MYESTSQNSKPTSPPITSSTSSTPQHHTATCFNFTVAFLAAIGGFLFGYDTGVVSGVLILIKPIFKLSTFMQEVFVSITLASAALFSLVGGVSNDRIGRKYTIITASMVFLVGSVVLATANHFSILLIGRFIVGIGIGLTSSSVPMYIAECSPKHLRGRFVTMFLLFAIFGEFFSSVVNVIFTVNKKDGWRYILGLAAIPAFVQFVCFMFMPKSPRWLMSKNRKQEARDVLMKINGIQNESEMNKIKNEREKEVDEELELIRKSIEKDFKYQEKGVFGTLRDVWRVKPVRRALLLGGSLQFIQQITGINTAMYYTASIIQMSGVENLFILMSLVAVATGVNFLSAAIGIWWVDKVGRRPLTLASLFGSFIALLVLASGFLLSSTHSPRVSLNIPSSSPCSSYPSCEMCTNNPSCFFCYESINTSFHNSFCSPLDYTYDQTFSQTNNKLNNIDELNENLKKKTTICNSVYNANVDKRNTPKTNTNTWTSTTHNCVTAFSWVPTLGLALYFLVFAPGMAPMPWTINSEIYPSWARSSCISIATSINWLFNLIVSLTFLSLVETLTAYGTFFMYAVFTLISFVTLFLFLPETKNTSLEEMEELFKGDFVVLGKETPKITSLNNYQSE